MTHLGTIGGPEPFGVAGFAPCPKYCGNGDARPYVEQDSRRSRHPLHRCCNLDAGDRVHLGRVDRGGALLRCYDNLLCGVRHKRGVRNQDSLVVLKGKALGKDARRFRASFPFTDRSRRATGKLMHRELCRYAIPPRKQQASPGKGRPVRISAPASSS